MCFYFGKTTLNWEDDRHKLYCKLIIQRHSNQKIALRRDVVGDIRPTVYVFLFREDYGQLGCQKFDIITLSKAVQKFYRNTSVLILSMHTGRFNFHH